MKVKLLVLIYIILYIPLVSEDLKNLVEQKYQIELQSLNIDYIIEDQPVSVFFHELDLSTDLSPDRRDYISPHIIDFLIICNEDTEYLRIEKEVFYRNETIIIQELSKSFQLDGWFIELYKKNIELSSVHVVPIFKLGTSITDGLTLKYFSEWDAFGTNDIYPIPKISIDINEPEFIKVARADITNAFEPYYIEQFLNELSREELRIMRNALFAFHGYKFNSQDLLDYFSNFEWYEPNPYVKNSLDTLYDYEKEMFEMIRKIESQ